MKYSIKLPADFTTKTIRELLEEDWLVPRKVRHFLRIRKNVLVNNEKKMFHIKVYANDVVSVIVEENDYPKPKVKLGATKNLNICYEDEHLLIVNKEAGIKTHPNQPQECDTLLNFLATYLKSQKVSPYVVHRLDKETSGLILFAKNPFVLPILSRMLARKKIRRKYKALVRGNITQTQFVINKKIGRNRYDRRKRIIDEKNGKIAITHVKVLAHNNLQSLLELTLDTGRTHQIRVHLASINHPIIGDPLYNPQNSAAKLKLVACEMKFTHPFTKKEIHIKNF